MGKYMNLLDATVLRKTVIDYFLGFQIHDAYTQHLIAVRI